MTAKNLIKKAMCSHAAYEKAQAQANNAVKEREKILREALMLVRCVSDAVSIYKLTGDDDTQKLAWKKAVILLAPTPDSLDDLISVAECGFRPTQKDADIQKDLDAKRAAILRTANRTMEQWNEVQKRTARVSYIISERAMEEMLRLLENCESRELLEQWGELHPRDRYGSKISGWDSVWQKTYDRLNQQEEVPE